MIKHVTSKHFIKSMLISLLILGLIIIVSCTAQLSACLSCIMPMSVLFVPLVVFSLVYPTPAHRSSSHYQQSDDEDDVYENPWDNGLDPVSKMPNRW